MNRQPRLPGISRKCPALPNHWHCHTGGVPGEEHVFMTHDSLWDSMKGRNKVIWGCDNVECLGQSELLAVPE